MASAAGPINIKKRIRICVDPGDKNCYAMGAKGLVEQPLLILLPKELL